MTKAIKLSMFCILVFHFIIIIVYSFGKDINYFQDEVEKEFFNIIRKKNELFQERKSIDTELFGRKIKAIIKEFDEIRKIAKKGKNKVTEGAALLHIAGCYKYLDDVKKTNKIYNKIVNKSEYYPKRTVALAYLSLGRLAIGQSDYVKASRYFEAIISKYPNQEDVVYEANLWEARSFALNKEYDKAAASYDKLVKLYPDDQQLMEEAGRHNALWAKIQSKKVKKVIRIGCLNDVTGPTSDVGKDMALGIREAIGYVNDHGGINGKKIELYQYDYGYRVPEAITTYKRFRDYDKVIMVLGWGTGDTEALSPIVKRDKMPYLSSSFSAYLSDPKKNPYNFGYATDYSTNARACIITWYEEIWMKSAKWKEARESGRKPRFVCFYSFSTPYSSAPIKAIKNQAKILKFEIGPDQNVSLVASDTKSQVLAAKAFKPDVVWHGNTTVSVATTINEAYALGLRADHIVNNWGFDRNLVRLCRKAAEGVIGAATCAFYGMDVPYMDKVIEYTKKINPGIPQEIRDIHTVQAWVKVQMAKDAIMMADKKGELNGPGIKTAFENFRNWSPFNTPGALGKAPVTFNSRDHRPSSVSMIYIIKGGDIKLLKKMDMRARYPDLWLTWLGW